MATTASIAVVAQFLGCVFGLASALAGLSKIKPLAWVSRAYVLVFRGTPIIVQIFFMYYGVNLFLGFDLFPRSVSMFGQVLDGSILAGIAALAINEGAYMSEIIRAGIESIDPEQLEASRSLAMNRAVAMRRIILPQAFRTILPPLGNDFNSMLKTTSLLFFIGVYEMFGDAVVHYSYTFKPSEYFAAVAVWYFVLTSIWAIIQSAIEARLSIPRAQAKRRGWGSTSMFRAAWDFGRR
jgi:polar amino acid transport system permease protein